MLNDWLILEIIKQAGIQNAKISGMTGNLSYQRGSCTKRVIPMTLFHRFSFMSGYFAPLTLNRLIIPSRRLIQYPRIIGLRRILIQQFIMVFLVEIQILIPITLFLLARRFCLLLVSLPLIQRCLLIGLIRL